MIQGGNVTLVGFVATEPKVRYVGTGTPVAHMRIGASSRWVDRETGEWVDLPTSYYTVRCWRRLAINAVGSVEIDSASLGGSRRSRAAKCRWCIGGKRQIGA